MTPRGLGEEEGGPQSWLFLSGERPPTPSLVPSEMVIYMYMPAVHTQGKQPSQTFCNWQIKQ